MQKQINDSGWRQYRSVGSTWGSGMRVGQPDGAWRATEFGSQTSGRFKALAASAWQSAAFRRCAPGLLVATAILLMTYSAAAALVSGAVSHSSAREAQEVILQQAAINYRRAYAQCLRQPAGEWSPCITEAHAGENRARAVAMLPPARRAATLRNVTDSAIDAGDRDNIVIEPACSVVARGQASMCEIQVYSGAKSAQATADSNRAPPRQGEAAKIDQKAVFTPGSAQREWRPEPASVRTHGTGA